MKEYTHYKAPKHRRAASQPMPARSEDQRNMYWYLASRDLNDDLARINGWYETNCANDDYSRIVIPCTNSAGRAYWQARYTGTLATVKRYQSPKYAAEDSIVVVWPNGKTVTKAVVVEGPMDALAAAMCNMVGVGIMGNRPNDAVIRNILAVLPIQDFIVVPDLDSVAAGGFISGKIALPGRRVTVRLPVGAKDLSRMRQDEREKLLHKSC